MIRPTYINVYTLALSFAMSARFLEIARYENPNDNWLGYAFRLSDPKKSMLIQIENLQAEDRVGVKVRGSLNAIIGKEYYGVKTSRIYHYPNGYVCLHVEIETSGGCLVLELYNEHNGFYLHEARIRTEHGSNVYYL